jgi:hypothetical protein
MCVGRKLCEEAGAWDPDAGRGMDEAVLGRGEHAGCRSRLSQQAVAAGLTLTVSTMFRE